MKHRQLIADAYLNYRKQVITYLYNRIGSKEDAEDLSQDVFLQLLDYEKMICGETLPCFIFTITRNLLFSYLRRYQKQQEVNTYLFDTTVTRTNDAEEQVIADDLKASEMHCVSRLPAQRRKIYVMSRFGERSVNDISERLRLSKRTVENHLRMGRKEVREYMRQCI